METNGPYKNERDPLGWDPLLLGLLAMIGAALVLWLFARKGATPKSPLPTVEAALPLVSPWAPLS